MATFNIIADLTKAANRGQAIIAKGYKTLRPGTTSTLKDVLEASLSNNLVSLKGIKSKLKNIFSIIENNDFDVMAIPKSSTSKEFRRIVGYDGPRVFSSNLSLIIIIPDDHACVQELGGNRISLTTDLIVETKGSDQYVYLELLNMNIFSEQFIFGGARVIAKSDSIKLVEEPTLLSNINISPLLNIEKKVNVFSDDTPLRINEWSDHVLLMMSYLDSKKADAYSLFTEDGINTAVDGAQECIILIRNDQKLKEKKRISIFNSYDNAIKLPIKIQNESVFNFNDVLEEDKKKISDDINENVKRISEFNKDISNIKDKILELPAEKKLIKIEYDKLKVFFTDTDSKKTLQEEILKTKEKELAGFQKQAKSLKKKSTNVTKKDETNDLKIIIKTLESEILKLKENVLEHKNQCNKYKDHVKELNKKIDKINAKESDMKLDIRSINERIKGIILENEKNNDAINKINTAIGKIAQLSLDGYVFKKLSFTFNFRKNEEIEEININDTTIIDFLEDTKNVWQVSEYDAGTLQIYKRMYSALKSIKFGDYKSPYLVNTLEDPNIPVQLIKDVQTNLQLNERQRRAAKAAINSHFATYLQGPPGTGKTQTISVVIENFAKEGQISLISSSTHEAINNVFDRVKMDNIDPNLIYLRQTSTDKQKEKVINFTEDYITFNILDQMDKFVLSSNGAEFNESLEWLIENQPKNINFNYVVPSIKEKYKIYANVEKDIDIIKEFLDDDSLENIDYAKEDLEDYFSKTDKKIMRSSKSIQDYFSKLEKFIIQNHISVELNEKYIDVLKESKKSIKSNGFTQAIQTLNDQLDQQDIHKSDLDKQIKRIVSDNLMINIIGITTTSRQMIRVNDKEFELFSEYPINFSVVDEVSKSITPEILSISMLSDKFMYSGDYRQLPPIMPFDDHFIKEYLDFINKPVLVPERKNANILGRLHEVSLKGLKEYLTDLYSSSIFTEQVKRMKSNINTQTNGYIALNEQYRFNSLINNIVNVFYDDSEKLIAAKKDNDFKVVRVGESRSISPVQIIDTSFISKEFADYVAKNEKVQFVREGMKAFDQKESVINNYKGSSLFNEYNAFVIRDNLLDMKKMNQNISNSDIGVIAITRTQANVIKNLINNIDELKGIKVDTVDNFQGREKEIIIIDLVRAMNKFDEGKFYEKSSRDLNFYKEPERLNVAVSRAKSKLIFVGAVDDYLAEEIVSNIKKNNTEYPTRILEEFRNMIIASEGGGN